MRQLNPFQKIDMFIKKGVQLYFLLAGIIIITGCSAGEVTEQSEVKNRSIEPTEIQADIQTDVQVDIQTDVKSDVQADTQEVSDQEKADEGKEEEGMKSSADNSQGAKKYSEAGALHVEGIQLTDSKGEPIQLRGTSTHGLAWFPKYVNQEFFLELGREWNVNVVRLAMYTAESGGYCTDGDREELKQLVKDGVEYATRADLYVIVDWHILSDGNPHTYKEEAKQFFAEISEEFATYENIIYEICNEPNGNVSWEDVKAYAEEIIPVIRANDEDAVIIVGTPTWSQDVDKAAANPITSYDNIMYALHFYAATHTDWLRDRMVNALEAGLPVFVSEFGTCDASGNGGIDYVQSNAWIQKMDEYGVSYVTWNLSNKGETSAIFLPGCYKTAGFTEEDLSENGKWIYEMLTGEHLSSQTQMKEEGQEEKSTAAWTDSQSNVLHREETKGNDGDIQYTAVISNSWEAEGKYFYQYNLTLKNTSSQKIKGWKLTLRFSDAVELSDGWNGNYTTKEHGIEITSKEYNEEIPSQGEVLDVGFIISGVKELELLEN